VVSAAETEPTWQPPEVVKFAVPSAANIGDEVQFFVTVRNRLEPTVDYSRTVSWFQVTVTDVVVAEFEVTDAEVTEYLGVHGPPVVEHDGKAVTVTLDIMEPGEAFLLTIDTILAGPAAAGAQLPNEVKVSYYTDEEGRLGLEYLSSDTKVTVGNRVMLPIVARNYGP
jgi:hypothetical protein